ncbi:DUF2799 domain-containing protein [Paucibacter sp. APW11]|uniref:DUF2799 domain-containing protein n=1 Tax=Roseateles aquae TaxID=3077235 RepID=A0ABU3PGL9_9BURK|nr:DUF2799 domain-containing protein [Paucibacter sp. APW11]MDT9001691.1 DUF2799 domain-containing protein [Paucibacter sp. APW11]
MAVCAVLLALSGCASMSEDQCRRADWQQQGTRDGRDGYGRDRVGDHAEACAKVGVVPDEPRWLTGWSDGVRQYCRPARGWELGLRGEYYRGVCADQPGGDEFERYYEAAKRVYTLGQQLDRNYSEMQRLERSLADAKTDEERKQLRAQLRELDIEQQRLRARQRVELTNAPR